MRPEMPDDLTRTIDLVRLAQAGEKGALDRLCARYYERVRVLVRARLAPPLRRIVDSGDVLQETFLQAVRNFDRFEMREDAALIHWLAKISERQVVAIVDRERTQKRDRAREVALDVATAGSHASDDPGDAPAEATARSEEDEAVAACLDELAPEQREVILLRDYAGASWPMIVEEHARALVELGRRLRAKGIR
jgi:RNA polymerase sigma-70 factor (ECF subfamily)